MYSVLLVIIYIAFISLGLPDSILGSAWPSMYGGLGVPVSYAGIISMIISAGTIISSAFSAKITNKLGTGLVTAVSVAMTAAALFGFSISDSFILLCVWAVPYGLGAGSVDAALNNFVALHYKSRHMSWLHCFWGIGATLGPYIMGICLTGGFGWHTGYRMIGILQTGLVIVLIGTLSLWKNTKTASGSENEKEFQSETLTLAKIFKLPKAKQVFTAFFCYCAVENTAGLWAGSYLVACRGLDAQTAAKWASLFYLGITGGRFLCGFAADTLGDKNMVRLGQAATAVGILMLFIPAGKGCALAGLILIGMGCAPVYPSLIHQTPVNFGARYSQSVIGLQMASAYMGTTLMPPFFGFLSGKTGLGLYPVYLFVIMILMIVMTEMVHRKK